MLFWRVPTTTANHRLGGRMGPYRQGRPFRTVRTFQLCHLNKHHMVSIAVGLGVITLLLVIFAYHGGYGVGSWMYSLLVVLSGLAFVVFGPLLLCRFLMHAYYRQLEARTMRLRATAQTQTGEAVGIPDAPQVYACIIITQDGEAACPNGRGATRLSDLPTYDEAILGVIDAEAANRGNGTGPIHPADETTENHELTSERPVKNEGADSVDLGAQQRADTGKIKCKAYPKEAWSEGSCSFEKDEIPPPSYNEALELVRTRCTVASTNSATDGQDPQHAENPDSEAATDDNGRIV